MITAHPAIDKIAQEINEIDVTTLTMADLLREASRHVEQAHGAFTRGERVCTMSATYLALRARGLA